MTEKSGKIEKKLMSKKVGIKKMECKNGIRKKTRNGKM